MEWEIDELEKEVPVNVTHHEMPVTPKGAKPFMRWMLLSGMGLSTYFGWRKFRSGKRRSVR